MRTGPAILTIGIVALLAACAPPPAPPLNSPAFVRRAPLPGQPGYLDTIKYIADGLTYISPGSTFFVSSAGELCFQGLLNPVGTTLWVVYQNYWCMSPMSVGTVEALDNDVSAANEVRLWCRHAAPQCAHKIGYPNMLDTDWIGNSITAETIPSRHERAAIAHLVYLMGGDVGDAAAALR
jgi:hypothetical protein